MINVYHDKPHRLMTWRKFWFSLYIVARQSEMLSHSFVSRIPLVKRREQLGSFGMVAHLRHPFRPIGTLEDVHGLWIASCIPVLIEPAT